MKRFFLFLSLFVSACAHAQTDVVPKKPSLAEGLVVDQTNTLTPEQLATLRQKLIAYDNSTSNQIAIVIIPSLKGNSLEDVALEIGRTWGVGGQADKDNGVLILVVKNDKKMRIEVGYGLEGAVTDYTASSIIQNNLRPNFQEGNYYRGLTEAIDEIIKAAEGRYAAPEGYRKKEKGIKKWHIILAAIVIWMIIGAIGRGGRGGGMVSRRGYSNWGGPIWWGGGGLGGGSGGGWSGGGGGGFGGFGGGSFGGGGASGSW